MYHSVPESIVEGRAFRSAPDPLGTDLTSKLQTPGGWLAIGFAISNSHAVRCSFSPIDKNIQQQFQDHHLPSSQPEIVDVTEAVQSWRMQLLRAGVSSDVRDGQRLRLI